MNYDFSQLNSYEFEILVADLLSKHFSTLVDTYKSGKDGGIDGRIYTSEGNEIIIQCKHYVKTGYSGLISEIKKIESIKVSKLNPKRYIFVTSLSLSKVQKEEIKAIFCPYITDISDIFSQENLNALLNNFPDVQKKHYKLWISSTIILENILSNIINNNIYGRSKSILEIIHSKSSKYVETASHKIALDKLKQDGIIIITGEPGAGKTTLAENIALFMASEGYEFVYLNDIKDAEDVCFKGKQLFLYDDFLGANYFEAIQDKKDSQIIHFMERIKRDNDKLFILTSRSNILHQGLNYSQYFQGSFMQSKEYCVTISNLSEWDKAYILYNHLYHSAIPESYKNEILIDKRYKKIVNHKGFNPRLIEYIVDYNRLVSGNIGVNNYWDMIENILNNPKEIWEHPFNNQLNQFARNIILLVVFNGGRINEGELKSAFMEINKLQNIIYAGHLSNDFLSVIKILVGSFLNKTLYPKGNIIEYSLFNPSIGDFILTSFCGEIEFLKVVFLALRTTSSLSRLNLFKMRKILEESSIKEIKDSIMKFDSWNTGDYGIFMSYEYLTEKAYSQKIIEFIIEIIAHPFQSNELYKFLILIEYFEEDLKLEDIYFMDYFIGDELLGDEEIRNIGMLCDRYDFSSELENCLRESIIESITQSLQDNTSIDYDSYIEHISDYDDCSNSSYSVDEDGIRKEYESILKDAWAELSISGTVSELDIPLDDIIESFYDEDDILSSYGIEDEDEDRFSSIIGNTKSSRVDIDYLFAKI